MARALFCRPETHEVAGSSREHCLAAAPCGGSDVRSAREPGYRRIDAHGRRLTQRVFAETPTVVDLRKARRSASQMVWSAHRPSPLDEHVDGRRRRPHPAALPVRSGPCEPWPGSLDRAASLRTAEGSPCGRRSPLARCATIQRAPGRSAGHAAWTPTRAPRLGTARRRASVPVASGRRRRGRPTRLARKNIARTCRPYPSARGSCDAHSRQFQRRCDTRLGTTSSRADSPVTPQPRLPDARAASSSCRARGEWPELLRCRCDTCRETRRQCAAAPLASARPPRRPEAMMRRTRRL